MTDWTSFYGPVDDRVQSNLAGACHVLFRKYLPEDGSWRDRAFADLEHLAPGVQPSDHVDRGLLDEARARMGGELQSGSIADRIEKFFKAPRDVAAQTRQGAA